MKRIIITALSAVAALTAVADSYFMMGTADTLTIRPAMAGDTLTLPMHAHFDARVGQWTVECDYPEGMTPVAAFRGPDMDLNYIDSTGTGQVYHTLLGYHPDFSAFLCMSTENGGYAPYGDGYRLYGQVKWDAGDYDAMFFITFAIQPGFSGGRLTVHGILVGSHDWTGSGVGLGVLFYRFQTVVVERLTGDVDGDGEVGIADVTALINHLLTGSAIDAVAADVDGDGEVGINDVTALMRFLLTGSIM